MKIIHNDKKKTKKYPKGMTKKSIKRIQNKTKQN